MASTGGKQDRAEEHVEKVADGSPQFRTVIEYDPAGFETMRKGYDQDGRLIYTQLRTYSRADGGRSVQTVILDHGDSVTETRVVRFDEEDRILEGITWLPDGTVIDRQNYAYDDEAKEVKYRRWSQTGELVEEWTRTWD